MKNLKKVLALVVVFSMMLSTVAFAAFPDVDEDADYATAVNTLAALGIVSGDDQGNYNPDNTITRSEFTKIICEAQAIKGDASKGATIFPDVAADHWASGYINLGVGQGIINGYPDGTFGPEDVITYEQIIKMIVVALGYEPMAADRGGYPTGYMVVAQSIGLTKGINAPAQTDGATRALVAELIFNALDCPMMEQTGFGDEKKFEIMDGSSDKARKTLLTEKFDVVKLGAVVIANEKVTIDGSATEDQIDIRVYNTYKTTHEDFGPLTAYATLPQNFHEAIYVADTNAADFIGKKVVIYLEETYRGWDVIAIVEDAALNTVEFSINDIDLSRSTLTGTDREVAYFADASKNSVKLKLEDGANLNVRWNGDDVASTLASGVFTAANISGASAIAANVTLVDWDNNDKFDYIEIAQYTHYFVDEIKDANKALRLNTGRTLYLDADEVDYDITITDIEGNPVAFDDIAVDDVIAVLSDNRQSPWLPTDYIDIVVLGQNAIEGTVTSYDASNGAAKTVVIGDASYVISAEYKENKIAVTSEGAYYLDINGKIFAFDGSKAASGSVGFVIKAGSVMGGVDANTIQFKLLNKDGQIVVYNLAKKVRMNPNLGGAVDTAQYDIHTAGSMPAFTNTVYGSAFSTTTATKLADFFAATANNDGVWTNNEGIYAEEFDVDNVANYADSVAVAAGNTAATGAGWDGTSPMTTTEQSAYDGAYTTAYAAAYTTTALEQNITARVIQYKANANGEIIEITPAGAGTNPEDFFTVNATNIDTNATYNANTQRLGAGRLDANTTLFSLNASDIDRSKVVSIDSLVDDANYKLLVVEEDDIKEAVAAIILSGGNSLGKNEMGMAVVTSIADVKDENGNDAKVVYFVENSETAIKSITVTEDTDFADDMTGVAYANTPVYQAGLMSAGSVFLYAADEAGNAVVFAPIANISGGVYTAVAGIDLDCVSTSLPYGPSSNPFGFVAGVSNGDFDGFEIPIVRNDGTHTTIEFLSSTNQYRVNNANANNVRIEVGSFEGGSVVDPAADGAAFKGNAFIARILDGDVVDIVSVNSRVALSTARFSGSNLILADGVDTVAGTYDITITTSAGVAFETISGAAVTSGGNITLTSAPTAGTKYIVTVTDALANVVAVYEIQN